MPAARRSAPKKKAKGGRKAAKRSTRPVVRRSPLKKKRAAPKRKLGEKAGRWNKLVMTIHRMNKDKKMSLKDAMKTAARVKDHYMTWLEAGAPKSATEIESWLASVY